MRRRRDRQAAVSIWTSAYARHEPDILAFLSRRLPREDAEDICQETFARAVAAGDALRDPGSVRAYLFRIAHNLMVNHLRRRGRVRIEADLGTGVDLELLAGAAEREGPEARRAWEALSARLAARLDELPADQRRAFRMGALERRPYAEIAAATGWSRAKVKIDVFRARRRLIEELRDWRPEGADRRADTNRSDGADRRAGADGANGAKEM